MKKNIKELWLLVIILQCNNTERFRISSTEQLHSVSVEPEIRVVSGSFEFEPTIAKPGKKDAINATCALSSIPGRLFGSTDDRFFNIFKVTNNISNLDLKQGHFNNHFIISRLSATTPELRMNLVVNPEEAQFSRVATFCEEHITMFATDSGNYLTLVYFDRPVTIQGTIESSKYHVTVNLRIPQKGFYFLQETRKAKGVSVFDNFYQGKDVHLALEPSEKSVK